jgi:hypothetical protein
MIQKINSINKHCKKPRCSGFTGLYRYHFLSIFIIAYPFFLIDSNTKQSINNHYIRVNTLILRLIQERILDAPYSICFIFLHYLPSNYSCLCFYSFRCLFVFFHNGSLNHSKRLLINAFHMIKILLIPN